MNLKLFLFALLSTLFVSPVLSLAQTGPDITTASANEFSASRFVVSLNGGLAYLTGSTKTAKAQMRSLGFSNRDIDRYFRDYKLGEFGEASIHYMIDQTLGFGIDYNVFTTQGKVLGFVDPGDGWTKYYGEFSDKVYTNFIGASCLMREKINDRWGYYNKVSLGMAFYRDEINIINSPMLVTGKSFAMYGEIGMTYALTKHVSVNMGLSYFISTLGKIKSDNGTTVVETKLDKDSKENLSRLNLSTGLLFNF
jgi:hypothetical protein